MTFVKTTPNILQTYRTITNYYGKQEYSKRFFKQIHDILSADYGKKRADEISGLLKNDSLKILNPETFLNRNIVDYEPSTRIFKSATSLSELFSLTTIYYNRLIYEGCSTIKITNLFLQIAVLLNSLKGDNSAYLQPFMDMFIAFLCNLNVKSPFVIQIYDKFAIEKAQEYLSMKCNLVSYYRTVLLSFFEAYDKYKSDDLFKMEKPKIETLVTIYNNARVNQVKYLSYIFSLEEYIARTALKGIGTVEQNTLETRVVLEYLRSRSNYSYIDIDSVLRELIRIEKECPYRTFTGTFQDYLYKPYFPKRMFSSHQITYKFILEDSLETLFNPSIGEIEINCNDRSVDAIALLVKSAMDLCLSKYREFRRTQGVHKPQLLKGEVKILLTNLHPIKKEFISEVNSEIKKLESLYDRKIGVVMEFREEDSTTKCGANYPTHIRIISDMHADINEGKYEFNFGDDFVVNCGDTSGDCLYTTNWVRSNIRKGVFVSGNHLGYNQPFPELNGEENLPIHNSLVNEKNTLNGQIKYLAGEFASYEVRYLNDTCYEYQGIIFIGCTLYTNYQLFGIERILDCKEYAKHRMNDFRLPKAFANWENNLNLSNDEWTEKYRYERIVTPDPNLHINYHMNSMRYLTEKVREYKGYPIVIVTHHAPLPYSISPQYKNDPLSVAFASNLTYFFKKFPYVRLWSHGHCVDQQTEILTPSGWKNINSINDSTEVLNLNIETNQIEHDNILSITNNNYSGNVYHFVSKGTNMRVTDEHRMLNLTSNKKSYKFMTAKEFAKSGVRYAIRAAQQQKRGLPLPNDYIRLLVWIAADGNQSTKQLIRFSLRKKRKINRLKELLNRLNISFNEYVHKSGMTSINFYRPKELNEYSFKPIDSRIINCTREQAKIVLEEYSYTDGVKNGNSIIIYTSKKEEADAIQLMCVTNNIACTIATRINHGFKLKDSSQQKLSYELNIVFKNYRVIDNIGKSTTIEKVENEKFWCVSTKNGTIITRRNGRVNIMGNCHHNNDYIFGETRVVSCPFGYYNENNVNTLEYGKRISIEDIKSTESWKKILESEISQGIIKTYDMED